MLLEVMSVLKLSCHTARPRSRLAEAPTVIPVEEIDVAPETV
jgi:hypothetical protein